jgi:hypothetical protein
MVISPVILLRRTVETMAVAIGASSSGTGQIAPPARAAPSLSSLPHLILQFSLFYFSKPTPVLSRNPSRRQFFYSDPGRFRRSSPPDTSVCSSCPPLHRWPMRRSMGGLHRRHLLPRHARLTCSCYKRRSALGTAEGQARPFLDLGSLHQLPPYRRLPSSLPLYRLDVAKDLAYSMGEEEEQMVLVQPCTF